MRLWSAINGTPDRRDDRAQDAGAARKPEAVGAAGVEAVAVSPDDQLIASSSMDGRILLWDAQYGNIHAPARLSRRDGRVLAIRSVSFSPDGQWVLAASEFAGCAVLRRCHGAGVDRRQSLRKAAVRCSDKVRRDRCNGGVTYSPDGRLAAAAYNSVVHVLDPRTSKAIKTLQSAGAPVFGVGFARDGRGIAWGNTMQQGADKKTQLTHRLRLPHDGRRSAPLRRMRPLTVSTLAPAPSTDPGRSHSRRRTDADQHPLP